MDELLHCPFCGTAPELEKFEGIRSQIDRWGVMCPNPDCGPVRLSEAEAIAWWNTRAAAAIGAEREA